MEKLAHRWAPGLDQVGDQREGENQDAGLAATAQKGREEGGRVAPGVPASAAGWGRKDSRVVLGTGQVTPKCKHPAASVVCGHSSRAHGQTPFSCRSWSGAPPAPLRAAPHWPRSTLLSARGLPCAATAQTSQQRAAARAVSPRPRHSGWRLEHTEDSAAE